MLGRWIALSGAVALLLMSTGCATIVTGRGPDQSVRINSQPRGAQVFVNGERIGTTPMSVQLSRRDDNHVRIEMEGYRPYERYLETRFNPWILGNIPIFFPIGTIIGVIVDLQNDADRWLRPGEISVHLVPDRPGEPAAAQEQPQDPDPAVIEVDPVPEPDGDPPGQ